MVIIQKAWGSYQTVTVGELRGIIADVPDDAELVVEVDTDPSEDDWAHVREVKYSSGTSISGRELVVRCGERFGY